MPASTHYVGVLEVTEPKPPGSVKGRRPLPSFGCWAAARDTRSIFQDTLFLLLALFFMPIRFLLPLPWPWRLGIVPAGRGFPLHWPAAFLCSLAHPILCQASFGFHCYFAWPSPMCRCVRSADPSDAAPISYAPYVASLSTSRFIGMKLLHGRNAAHTPALAACPTLLSYWSIGYCPTCFWLGSITAVKCSRLPASLFCFPPHYLLLAEGGGLRPVMLVVTSPWWARKAKWISFYYLFSTDTLYSTQLRFSHSVSSLGQLVKQTLLAIVVPWTQ